MEFKGLTSASHMSLPEAGYGSEEGYVGSEISGAVSGVTTPGASRLQASQLQQRSTTMQRLHLPDDEPPSMDSSSPSDDDDPEDPEDSRGKKKKKIKKKTRRPEGRRSQEAKAIATSKI